MTLQSRHDVVTVIADATGLSELKPDALGNFEIIIGDSYSCFFNCADEEALVLEMAVRVETLDGKSDPATLRGMLQINTASDAGRLALEPGTGRAFWSQRLIIVEHSRQSLLRAIEAFLRAGLEMRASAKDVIAAASHPAAPVASDDMMIRL